MIRRAGKAVAGITLIEVMIVVAILAVLVALAAPNLSELFIRNRLDTAANEFETTLNFARSEAIRRGAKVVVRHAPGSANQQWSRGWEVFVDLPSSSAPNGNNLRDAGEDPVIATADRRPRSRVVMVSDSGRIRLAQPNDAGRLIVDSASNTGTAEVTDCRNP